METKDLKWGHMVMVSGEFYSTTKYASGGSFKQWNKSEWKYQKPVLGIFLGRRSIKEGEIVYDGEYGSHFEPSKHISCAYVSLDGKTNPIYVSLEFIKPIT